MPVYVIERNFAEQLALTPDDVAGIRVINDEEGVRWLLSFLSVDGKKSYCVFEAPDPEALYAQARRVGVPADVIVEVNEFRPNVFAGA